MFSLNFDNLFMPPKIVQVVALGLALACGIFALILIFDLIQCWRNKKAVGDIPVIHQPSRFMMSPWLPWTRPKFDYYGELKSAYEKYSKNGQVFAMPFANSSTMMIILPPECSREYCHLPTTQSSFIQVIQDEMGLDGIMDLTWKATSLAVIASSKSTMIARIDSIFGQQLNDVLPLILGPSHADDWRDLKLADTIAELFLKASMPMVFGSEFSKKIGDTAPIGQFLVGLSLNAEILRDSPKILEPFLKRFSPTCRSFKSALITMRSILIPEIERRISLKRVGIEKPEDCSFMDAMIEQAMRSGELDRAVRKSDEGKYIQMIADGALFLQAESIGPTSAIASGLLLRAIHHPEFLKPLRSELEKALKCTDGKWIFDIFKCTPLLESFTKETVRLNGPTLLSGNRKILEPVKIESLGLTFPVGTYISLPSLFVHQDPDNYPDPFKFDPYRFLKDSSDVADSRGTISPTDTWLAWGRGSSLCPARQLGTRISQLVFSKILYEYDIELPSVKARDLPQVLYGGGIAMPNAEAVMRVKGRRQGDKHE